MPGRDRGALLEAIRRLPPDEQRELALEILREVHPASAAPTRREPPAAPDPRSASAMSLRGIAKTGQPLDDEALLEESRMERYGE